MREEISKSKQIAQKVIYAVFQILKEESEGLPKKIYSIK